MDKSVEIFTIKEYLKLIKNTNMSLDDDTILANNVREKTCKFKVNNIPTDEFVQEGIYIIEIMAYDEMDNMVIIELPIRVVADEVETKNEKINIGRFFYDKDGQKCVEELNKLKKDEVSEGFICAGETLAVVLKESNADYLEINIEGDESVKCYDTLTKLFLEDEPKLRGESVENIEENYIFPLKIYPTIIDEENGNEFIWLYSVPYGTFQTLESWSTLRDKNGDSENIDKNSLLDRIIKPYELVIRKNGEKENEIRAKFDVFERWDTILNRNVSSYLSNYSEKWRIEI